MNARCLGALSAGAARLGTVAMCSLLLAMTVNAAPADDIRDIRGPKPFASPWTPWVLAGGGVILVWSAYALWRWIKRRRKAPEKSDLDLALDRLEAARALMQPGRARDFSIEVSAIVREYIERRFGVMAAHRTTHEFLHDLVVSAAPGLAAHRELLGDFLQSCDLAKFGGWSLDIDQMSTMRESARRFIQSASVDRTVRGDAGGDSYAASATQSAAPAGSAPPTASGKPHVSFPST